MRIDQKITETAASWQHFPHVADMGIRGFGASCSEAFAQAALALTAIICDPSQVRPAAGIEIHCSAPDRELLLVDWLNALVYEMAIRRMLFSRFDIDIEGNVLNATVWGEIVDRLRHQPAVEVKGATYTELKVGQELDGRWYAQCVVDV